ncbi:unnamed protein product [Candida verbasci]|uniref:Lariat debranching enzyme C-terminal domain-containing protein n=1 Tax=Candida verbasci TaxID=1227364 RepID=A0A9W4U338_9ASCO|nr:unnamed protein product [Candida verbasci]
MVKIAIEGCCHGSLNQIYSHLNSKKIDLLLICGDFQAIRNKSDFKSLNVPLKYQQMGDFHEYYSGLKTAPITTIFIGGNHECSTYLKELKYGGWVAQNIYYLGSFGSLYYKGLQICGYSGIFNYGNFIKSDLNLNYDEVFKLPLNQDSIRSIYHVNLKNFIKMCLINDKVDIILSHDWPVGIEKFGNKVELLKRKPFFKKDIELGRLGSPLNKFLIHYLKPKFWFSGHLHVKFEATIKNQNNNNNNNKEEISLDMDSDDDQEIEFESINYENGNKRVKLSEELIMKRKKPNSNTHFLALDKVGNNRQFINIKEIQSSKLNHPSMNDSDLYYSKRAIIINKVVESYFNEHKDRIKQLDLREIIKNPYKLTLVSELQVKVEEEIKSLELKDDDLKILDNFKVVAPPTSDNDISDLKYYKNNQTDEYCDKFNIPNIDIDKLNENVRN